MSLYSFVDRLREPSNWLPEQQWARWCLIIMAASVFFLVLLKIFRRKRRQPAGVAHVDHFNQSAQGDAVTYAKGMNNIQPVGRSSNQKTRIDPTELVVHPEISIRQLRREIFKRDRAEARLEHEIEELKIANEQLRQQIIENKKTCDYYEKKIADLTSANEAIDLPVAKKEIKTESEIEIKTKESSPKEESRPKVTEKGDQKQCRKCKKYKPLTDFHKNASSHDGLARWCKACKTKAAKESRQKRAAVRRAAEQQADMCADAPLCVLHHRQTDRIKNARRRAGHTAYKAPEARQIEHRSHRFRSQLSSPGLRCPRRQIQREQGKEN